MIKLISVVIALKDVRCFISHKILLTFLIYFIVQFTLIGQRVLQSKEINIKTDYYYDIFNFNQGNSLLLRNQGTKMVCELFDANLEYIRNADIELESERTAIEQTFVKDDLLYILYSYRDSDGGYIMMRTYDQSMTLVDTPTVVRKFDKKPLVNNYKCTTSENKAYSILFGTEKDNMHFYLIDNKSKKIQGEYILNISTYDIRDEMRGVILTNAGKVLLFFEKDDMDTEKHRLIIYESTGEGDFFEEVVDWRGYSNTGLAFAFDEFHNKLIIGGLYENKNEILGTFVTYYELTTGNNTTHYNEFMPNVKIDLFGKNTRRNQVISDFVIQDLIVRNDGGAILISEMKRELLRRPNYGPVVSDFGNNMRNAGLVDYYNEDIIAVSINNLGKEDWYKVLYKKQFSQDDNGVYSSFFVLKNPSRLHILYNDEIKKSSTVSEYRLSPSGRYDRKAVLNTEYQNMNLRFKDAVQIGPTEILIPSERNLRLTLVKINI